MSALVIDGLSAGYGGAPVLRGVTLTLRPGEAAALFGANGSGKSTLLRAINGLLTYRGDVRFGEKSIRGLSTEQIAALGIAHVPQGRGTFIGFTVEQNLALGGSLLRGRWALAAEIERIYARIPELRDRRRQMAGTLSGGEQQMLALGRALMMRPKLLLLDEPSHGLAPKIVCRFFEMLAELGRATNMSLLLVEQNPALVTEIAETAYLLEHGRISLTGAPGDSAFTARLWQTHLQT